MNLNNNISLLPHQEFETAQLIHEVFQNSYKVEAKLLGIDASIFPPLLRPVESFQTAKTMFYGYWKVEKLAAVTEVTINEQVLSICSFVVDPSFFRQGIAKELLDYILGTIVWRKAEVETGADNRPAIALYEKFGFVVEKKWLIEELSVWKVLMIQER